jgi:hypothetical protein
MSGRWPVAAAEGRPWDLRLKPVVPAHQCALAGPRSRGSLGVNPWSPGQCQSAVPAMASENVLTSVGRGGPSGPGTMVSVLHIGDYRTNSLMLRPEITGRLPANRYLSPLGRARPPRPPAASSGRITPATPTVTTALPAPAVTGKSLPAPARLDEAGPGLEQPDNGQDPPMGTGAEEPEGPGIP